MSSSLAPALRLLSCITCLRRFCNSDKKAVLPNVMGAGAAAAARPSPRATALDEVGAAEGADWEGSVTATVDDLARELDVFAALLGTAEAADEAGDLLGVSLLLPPLSNASNSSSSKLVKASTSRCEGKDMTKPMSRRLQFGY